MLRFTDCISEPVYLLLLMFKYSTTSLNIKALKFADESEAYGIQFQGYSFGKGKYCGRKFLEAVSGSGWFVIQE